MNNNSDNQPVDAAALQPKTVIVPTTFTPATDRAPDSGRRIRIGSILISIILVLCSAIVWFIFSARSVYIEVDPASNHIEIQGGIKLKLADRFLIRSGDYQLSIEAPGYYPLKQLLSVNDQQNQHYTFTLQRLPGHLNISSSPATTAEIRIDGELRGKTPTTIRDIAHGEHALRIDAERYLPFTTSIEIEGRGHEQTLVVELLPAWAELSFASQPAGADVYIDENIVGQTPLTTEILQGKHEVRIKLSGYKSWQKKIMVTANQPFSIPEIELALADAVIFLETRPSSANITINGEYKGQTPIEIAVAPDKTFDIRFFKQGYQQSHRKLKVKSGDKQRLRVNLQAELSPIEFNSTPADAELYVDGKLRGLAKQILPLSTKPHRIEIRKQGYVTYQTTVTPRAGIAQQVTVSLKTLRQARQESIKAIIKSSAGQTLKLFHPTSVIMGASRREAGRRANETLREVNLSRAFYLSLNEITNAEYHAFDRSHSSGDVQGNQLNDNRHPVVKLTWDQAALYCNWLSKREKLPLFYIVKDNKVVGFRQHANGYRLPSEAEWAWVARVQPNQQQLKFPWGESLPPTTKNGNYADDSAADLLGRIIHGYNDGFVVTAPVGSFPADRKGIFDMGGNVSEWVHDYYDITIVQGKQSETALLGPASGQHHVIKGSSWAHGSITELRLSYRDYGNDGRDDVGFRIARYLE